MIDLPATREAARLVESKAYFTGRACKHGHIAKRWTATGNCSACQRSNTDNWVKNNPEKFKAYLESDERRKSTNESLKRFYQRNKAKYIAKDANRRALKLQATTEWGQEKVEDFYQEAKRLEEMNPNVKYHVDHIIPLVNKKVCGLHNQFNLQVLTEIENKRKGNVWN
jgi:hypothetical protein